jgi:hypothetical protein
MLFNIAHSRWASFSVEGRNFRGAPTEPSPTMVQYIKSAYGRLLPQALGRLSGAKSARG